MNSQDLIRCLCHYILKAVHLDNLTQGYHASLTKQPYQDADRLIGVDQNKFDAYFVQYFADIGPQLESAFKIVFRMAHFMAYFPFDASPSEPMNLLGLQRAVKI